MDRYVKRIASDVSNVLKEPLDAEGIHYIHDEDDISVGRAMIIGPRDSLYSHGIYLFRFQFPRDYPLNPPTVFYCTNDGATRFNPNLYRDGKVCLSVLNTWKGEGWTSCLTLRSVLMILQSVLTDKPILNEPGMREGAADYKPYHEIVKYKNYDYALLGVLGKGNVPDFAMFRDIMLRHFIDHYSEIVQAVHDNDAGFCAEYGKGKVTLTTHLYSMKCVVDYRHLLARLAAAERHHSAELEITGATNTIIESN